MIADPHCPNAMGIGWAEGPVAVANQVMRRFVPGKRVRHLTCDPLGGRIGSDADCYEPPTGVTQDHQAVEQLERDGAHHEQIHRTDAGSLIPPASIPTFPPLPATPHPIPS